MSGRENESDQYWSKNNVGEPYPWREEGRR